MPRFLPARRASLIALLGLCLLLTGVAAPLPALAADPVWIPSGPVPIDEELKPVELGGMAIDCIISAIDGGAALDTRTRAYLRNPNRKTSFERQVTFSGLPVANVRVGSQSAGLQPAEGAGPWQLNLRPEGDAIIEGRQWLSASGPLIELRFDWEALRVWGSKVGSARLTLHFPQDTQAEQLLIVDPEPTARSTIELTWSYERFEPSGQVRVLFIAPTYWQAVRQARQTASGPQAGVGDYLSLANALRPLLEAEGMPSEVAGGLRAELLSALRQGVAAGPKDARAHSELAAHLRAQANGNPGLLADAAAELKAAYDLAPGDTALKKRLLAVLDELMAACRLTGDTRGLLAALDLVEAVEPQGSQERAAAYAELAVDQLEEGRVNEAHLTIAAGFGQAELDRYAFLRPHFAAVSGEIQTHPNQRRLRFTLMPAPGMEQTARQDLATLTRALARIDNSVVKHTTESDQHVIEITVSYPESVGFRASRQNLIASLPAESDPALLLVAAAAPSSIEFQEIHQARANRLTYAETADLSAAEESLSRRLEQLRVARQTAEEQTDDPLEAARRRWVRALLDRYEADWQALVAGCRVTYELLPPEDLIAPRWSLAWGEQRPLAWSATIPHPERLWPWVLGGIVALLAASVVVAVLRAGRKSQRARGVGYDNRAGQ